MSSFKEMIQNDLKNVFLNPNEFGETHMIDGREMTIIIDEIELVKREARIKTIDKGLHKKQLLIYVSAEEFGEEPLIGRLLDLDGSYYEVKDVANEAGMYSISLEVNES